MQQTDKYKLNKPGIDDPLSPAPLNENMDKVDAALAAKTDAAETAALDARVQLLELRRFVIGTYVGNGEKLGDAQTIYLDFTPRLVITDSYSSSHQGTILCLEDYPLKVMEIIPGGFRAMRSNNETYDYSSLNTKGRTYRFAAFC